MTAVGEILAELRGLGVRIEPHPHGGVRLSLLASLLPTCSTESADTRPNCSMRSPVLADRPPTLTCARHGPAR